ncbi:MAG: hypothetical protein H6706_14090 [Myxococcales bacterium]|nr:hypothetical protein [Myxococcales bacterium]
MHRQGDQPQRLRGLDRLRHLTLALAALPLLGCGESATAPAPTGRRTAAVKAEKAAGPVNDPSGFCEKTWPAAGPEARPFAWPPLRPLPGREVAEAPEAAGQWRWVNLWATWCVPCVAEMGLLGRWTTALGKDGTPVALELLSIDAPTEAEALQARLAKGLPGKVRWLREEADLGPFLESLGISAKDAIPIHALVDPAGNLRCVRVGAIGGQDYAAVKGIVTGG